MFSVVQQVSTVIFSLVVEKLIVSSCKPTKVLICFYLKKTNVLSVDHNLKHALENACYQKLRHLAPMSGILISGPQRMRSVHHCIHHIIVNITYCKCSMYF